MENVLLYSEPGGGGRQLSKPEAKLSQSREQGRATFIKSMNESVDVLFT